jgi:hypothetical protein
MELKLFCLRHRATGALVPETPRPYVLRCAAAALAARSRWARTAGRRADDVEIVELAAIEPRAWRAVGSVDVCHAPGPLRRYRLHNNVLDELADGVFELYARLPGDAAAAAPGRSSTDGVAASCSRR